MSYIIPLVFIRVSPHMSVCATRINAMISTDTLVGRRIIKEERRARTLLNGAGKDPVKTAVIMDNGTIIASSYTVKTLERNIVAANNKVLGVKRSYRKHAKIIHEEDIVPDQEDLEEINAIDEDDVPDQDDQNGIILDDDEEIETYDTLELSIEELPDEDNGLTLGDENVLEGDDY